MSASDTTTYLARYGIVAPNKDRFDEHKAQYRRHRDDFRAHPRSLLELAAWKRADDSSDYQLFPSLAEYALHNPKGLILSKSDYSYIIGNMASYDSRQYPLALHQKRPEGQGFCHTLVIPRDRVFNVVDPDATANDCSLLKEMYSHFTSFLSSDGGKETLLRRARQALLTQDAKLLESNDSAYTTAVRNAVFADFAASSSEFMKLEPEDFIYGFHVFPDNSIGHLHMHVFPSRDSLRQWSTKSYDHKTVPLQAILEVEKEDARDK
ncbi:MAG: hypothetical protein Q9182_006374 [Xanthomendoza sp. 2 TL-2023]